MSARLHAGKAGFYQIPLRHSLSPACFDNCTESTTCIQHGVAPRAPSATRCRRVACRPRCLHEALVAPSRTGHVGRR